MSTFDELQADLGAARAEAEQRDREVVEGSERLHRLRRDRDLAARGGAARCARPADRRAGGRPRHACGPRPTSCG